MIDKNIITTIFIDVDGTILDFKKCQMHALIKACESLNIPINDDMVDSYDKINDNQWLLYEKGLTTKEKLSVERFRIFAEKYNILIDPALLQKKYHTYLGDFAFYLNGAKEGINKLSEKYDIYLITNGTDYIQNSRIKVSQLDKIIKDAFISDTIGYPKPYKEFFDYCFNKTKLKNNEVIVIGDSLSSDIKGGIEYNLKTIWFNLTDKKTDLKIDAEVHSWDELINLLF